MTTARLGAIAVQVADHPIAMARLLRPLAREVATLDDAAEARFADGTIVRFVQSKTPSRIGVRLSVNDLAAAALALVDHRTPWTVLRPNTIRILRGECTLDVTEVEPGQAPGLISGAVYVRDIGATTRFWQALGLTVNDATPTDANDDADPPEPATDVIFENARLELRGCGLRPVTLAHMLLRVEDPIASCVGLDYLSWGYTREEAALVTETPDGAGVRVTPPRRS